MSSSSSDLASSTSGVLGFELLQVAPIERASTSKPSPVWYAGGISEKGKVIIVLHEWWGVTPPLKDLSLSWFGDEFDIALLDLYRGDVATKITDATHLMNQLDFTGALRDIRATVKHLREKEGSTKVGLIGFGLGGCLALAASVHLRDIDCACICYGIPDTRFAPAGKVAIPIQLHFGAEDTIPGFSDPRAQAGLESQLIEGKVTHEFYRYPNAGHAFCNPSHTDEEEISAALKVKERAKAFFQAKLA